MTGGRPGRKWRAESGLVGKALVTLLVVIVVVGLALVDGGSILFAKLKVQDTAGAAAVEGAATYRQTRDAAAAKQAAIDEVGRRDSRDCQTLASEGQPGFGAGCMVVTSFEVQPDGTVTIAVKQRAHTFLVDRIGPIRSWGVVRATEVARPPTV